jgi:hypothetical protein
MFPQLPRFTALDFLLLRLMIGLVFVNSGYSDLKIQRAAPRASE